jgi:hypothetical protein
MRRLLFVATATLIATRQAHGQRPLAGVWETDGYGQVVEFTADSLKTFEITSVSCIPTEVLRATRAPANALGAYTFRDEPVTVVVLPEGSDRIRFDVGFAASQMVLHRIARKPAVCDSPTPNTPRSNFDAFAATFAEHYPFFAERKVNWQAVVDSNRVKVTDATTPQELFVILALMINPMHDAHTGISASTIGRTNRPVRQTASFVQGPQRAEAYALVNGHLSTPLRPFCQGQLEFAMIGSDIGYLRIKSFSRYSSARSFAADTAELGAALDSIFRGASSWKGLIVDVRLNAGGADPLGLIIAGRLTGTTYTAYAKQARSDPRDPTKWTAAQPSLVRATTRPGFRGPVVELIGVQSVSAAETFTQALLSRQPKVVRVGETTQGVFSDVLGRKLPNGWTFGLPNERFVTDGKSYDIVGIAPDVPVESLSPAARATAKDAAIEKAVEILRR